MTKKRYWVLGLTFALAFVVAGVALAAQIVLGNDNFDSDISGWPECNPGVCDDFSWTSSGEFGGGLYTNVVPDNSDCAVCRDVNVDYADSFSLSVRYKCNGAVWVGADYSPLGQSIYVDCPSSDEWATCQTPVEAMGGVDFVGFGCDSEGTFDSVYLNDSALCYGSGTMDLQTASCIVQSNLAIVGEVLEWSGRFVNPLDPDATFVTWLLDLLILGVAFAIVRRFFALVRG